MAAVAEELGIAVAVAVTVEVAAVAAFVVEVVVFHFDCGHFCF